jgi:hypothetical protein
MKVVTLFLWLSLVVTGAGIVLSAVTASRARGGKLAAFAVLVTLGFAVFGVHHAFEMFGGAGNSIISHGFELISSLVVLIATVYLGYSIRETLSRGRQSATITRVCAGPAAVTPDDRQPIDEGRQAVASTDPDLATDRARAPSGLRSKGIR